MEIIESVTAREPFLNLSFLFSPESNEGNECDDNMDESKLESDEEAIPKTYGIHDIGCQELKDGEIKEYDNVSSDEMASLTCNTPLLEKIEFPPTGDKLAASRRIIEADGFRRAGLYDGWLAHLFVGNLLKGQTVGVIVAVRIGSAYARMVIEGFKMNLIYYDLYQATCLEKFVTAYGQLLKASGEELVTWKRASSMDEVLPTTDVKKGYTRD
ncbi:glycerate dehydrogenase HPR, peroxisomal [Lactuca sativa]|uniref:glycerate dehydrogenase HPR, peroxisomal n=1 Tax=Lactuca sativa TaxID=4236 RepID=UPI000CD90026|nr:glycerate dehydrogenase HPR, peroxisomal [Lactuca sativa]